MTSIPIGHVGTLWTEDPTVLENCFGSSVAWHLRHKFKKAMAKRPTNPKTALENDRRLSARLKQDTLYTRKEVATMAKVCVHTIARDVRIGLLQEVKFNSRRLRYTSEAVHAYLSANYPSEMTGTRGPVNV
jgi:hypothetical protein